MNRPLGILAAVLLLWASPRVYAGPNLVANPSFEETRNMVVNSYWANTPIFMNGAMLYHDVEYQWNVCDPLPDHFDTTFSMQNFITPEYGPFYFSPNFWGNITLPFVTAQLNTYVYYFGPMGYVGGSALYRKCSNGPNPFQYENTVGNPQSGDAYGGFRFLSEKGFEYNYVLLKSPTQAGREYELSYYVAKGALKGRAVADGVSINLHVYTSPGTMIYFHHTKISETGMLDSSEWTRYTTSFVATGKESHLAFGVRRQDRLETDYPNGTWGYQIPVEGRDYDRPLTNNAAVYYFDNISLTCKPTPLEVSYANASFLNFPGAADHHQTINFTQDPSTFVLTPPTGNPAPDRLSLLVTKNGVETTIPYSTFLTAYQSSAGVTSQLLTALGFTLASGDHYSIKLVYEDCNKTTIGQLEVDVVCRPSAFEAGFNTNAPYLSYAGGNPATIDPAYDASLFNLSIPAQPNAFTLTVTGAGSQPIVKTGPEALTAYQSASHGLITFLQTLGAPIAIGQQVHLSLSYQGCATHPAGEIQLNLACKGSVFEQGVSQAPPLLMLSSGQTNIEVGGPQATDLVHMSSDPIYAQADTGKIFVVVTEDGVPRPTRLTYTQVKAAVQSSGGNIDQFLKAVGIVPKYKVVYGLTTLFEGACSVYPLGQLTIKTNYPAPITPPTPPAPVIPATLTQFARGNCQYDGAYAKVYPNPIAPGQTAKIKLQGVNDRLMVVDLHDSSGTRVARWEVQLTVTDPLISLPMPSGLANGVYIFWFRFPKCFVGSDLSAKVLIQK